MRRVVFGWLGAGLAATLGLATLAACGSSKATGGSTSTGGASSSTSSSGTTSSSGSSSGTGGATGSSSSGTGGATGGSTSTSSTSTSSTSTSSSSTTSSSGVVMAGDSVLQHHKNANRDGLYVQPTFTKSAIGTLHRDPSFTATLPADGGTQAIYAQPLFVDGMGGQDLVIVATEENNVYALDGATGAIVWAQSLGAAPSLPPLPCGDIFPMGITGTPVIDYASRTLFVDALVLLTSSTYHHQIFALSIDTGAKKTGWPVDVDTKATSGGTAFDSTAQGQQGALALFGGTLYVPYGNLFGDCPTFYGWVVAVPIADPSSVSAWATTYPGGGAWTTGGVSSDGTSLFVSTGTTFLQSSWGGGEAFIRLTPSPLSMSAYFAPANWYALGTEGLDMGTAPIPFDQAGSTPSTLAILFGEDGNAYLLDRTNPGGVGPALDADAGACTPTNFTNACASLHVATDNIISAPALYTTATATYVATNGNGAQCTSGSGDLLTIKIVPGSPPTVAPGWCATNGSGSPMVTTSDGHADAIVWDLGAENDDHLHAFDGDTGAAITFTDENLSLTGLERYNTPIAAKGRIFVAVDGGVVAFTL